MCSQGLLSDDSVSDWHTADRVRPSSSAARSNTGANAVVSAQARLPRLFENDQREVHRDRSVVVPPESTCSERVRCGSRVRGTERDAASRAISCHRCR